MPSKDKPLRKSPSEVVMLPGIYNEALKLLADAHDYFYRHTASDQVGMDNRERMMFVSEMSRVTIRLSCVMGWLMMRKTVFDGKIGADEVRELYRLDCRDVCINQHIEAESLLPARMSELLDKSFELYQRIVRLDEM